MTYSEREELFMERLHEAGWIAPDDGKLASLERMSRHAGACEAMLRVGRLLRVLDMRDAEKVLLENLESIADAVAQDDAR